MKKIFRQKFPYKNKIFVKRILLLFGFITFAVLIAPAQSVVDSGNGREKIKMLEIGYLTRQLQLSSNEAEKFWPTYNKYRQELRDAVKDRNISDELERQQKALDIKKRYRNDFSSILDERRGQQVFEAEEQFKKMVQKEMQQRIKMRQDRTSPQRKQK